MNGTEQNHLGRERARPGAGTARAASSRRPWRSPTATAMPTLRSRAAATAANAAAISTDVVVQVETDYRGEENFSQRQSSGDQRPCPPRR